jgi:hypothetical protein
LIDGHVLLGRRTGLTLNRSVLDDMYALNLLAVDDDWLDDAFLWGLRESGMGTSQHPDD